MVRKREFNEEQALDAAMKLFWANGFEATSLTDLTTGMGIQRPSLYATFGDKRELFESSLRKYNQWHAVSVRQQLQSHVSVQEAFRAFFEQIAEEAYGENPSKGCFCINTMVELATHDEKIEILTREHQMYLTVIFQERLEQGVQAGQLAKSVHTKSLAQTLIVSLIGLTVMLKSRPERSFIQHSITGILSLLKD
ncbi:TetR/AcrR family transcriptional regulator [Paenibacillus sp. PsM32]|uniref:TetR/AcrR family transcriptional regulator n=1 Tax=Paenibacillus sp. PsM32 TaxID=3030536 RepID=UPI00263B0972|nr:TetR/AcrR family transcriptional regulator [Paenibacillus sp. PsM32]MDN4620597.1 TetR/AcrR family transcriptional regulator [Paenibacillus sp. PsM32]